MCPKYFNIRRGVLFAVVIGGWAMVPWVILSSAKTFLSFMSAYAVFMAPIAGIMLIDYWIIKRRKYDVPALYDPRGIYHTWVSEVFTIFSCYEIFFLKSNSAQNWRALATISLVIVPMLPALANKVTPWSVQLPDGLINIFNINWLYGFFLSCVLYYGFNMVSPDRGTLIPYVVHGVPELREIDEANRASGSADGDNIAEKGMVESAPVEVIPTSYDPRSRGLEVHHEKM
jgi:NCS1 family nucleobase:cation symporter-1